MEATTNSESARQGRELRERLRNELGGAVLANDQANASMIQGWLRARKLDGDITVDSLLKAIKALRDFLVWQTPPAPEKKQPVKYFQDSRDSHARPTTSGALGDIASLGAAAKAIQNHEAESKLHEEFGRIESSIASWLPPNPRNHALKERGRMAMSNEYQRLRSHTKPKYTPDQIKTKLAELEKTLK